ncbi:MAG: hypothetical protein NTV68_10545 [Methanomicrobiales archaeon]|nr:hypothetical protein [Methanomicrobiales archaeon]
MIERAGIPGIQDSRVIFIAEHKTVTLQEKRKTILGWFYIIDNMKTGIPVLFSAGLLITHLVCGCSAPTPGKEPAVSAKSIVTTGVHQGWGPFVFNDRLGNTDRPITVYTYRPSAYGPVGAGIDRNSWCRS